MSSAAKSLSGSQLLQNAVEGLSAANTMEEYKGAPSPYDETERLITVNGLGKMDWVSQEQYDAFTSLVCSVFGVSLSVVSLIHENTQRFRSVQGLEGVEETPRVISFCAWALLPKNNEVLFVSDAHKDLRFFNNPAVTGPLQVVSYVGCPMVLSTGHRLGNLCGFANDPLKVSRRQVQVLCNITEVLVRQFEREQIQKCLVDQDHYYNHAHSGKLVRPKEVFEYGYLIVDVSTEQWKMCLRTDLAIQLIAIQKDISKDQLLEDYVGPSWITDEDIEAVQREERFCKRVKCTRQDGTQHWLQATFIPGHCAPLDEDMPLVQLPADLQEGNEKQYYFIQLQTASPPATPFPAFLKLTSQLLFSQDEQINVVQAPNSSRSISTTGSFMYHSENKTVQKGVRNGEIVVIKTITIFDDSENQLDFIYSNLYKLKQKFHPNLVQIIDVTLQKEENSIQIVMEYCDQGNLLQIEHMEAFYNQEQKIIFKYCEQIVQGLKFLHENVGIFHGRLSLENVMFCSIDENTQIAKICDAGLQTESDNFRAYKKAKQIDFSNQPRGLDDKAAMDDIEDLGRILRYIFRSCDSWFSQDIKLLTQRIVQKCLEIDTSDSSRRCLEEVILELQQLQNIS